MERDYYGNQLACCKALFKFHLLMLFHFFCVLNVILDLKCDLLTPEIMILSIYQLAPPTMS